MSACLLEAHRAVSKSPFILAMMVLHFFRRYFKTTNFTMTEIFYPFESSISQTRRYSVLIGIHAWQLTRWITRLVRQQSFYCNGGLNWNRCALQQSLFIQYVKTEKYNNIQSLKQFAIDCCTYNKITKVNFP